MERCISGELDLAPASDYRRLIAYHDEKVLARDARGGGGAQGEMERSTASFSGRTSQLQRGSAVELRSYDCCYVAGM